MIGNDKKTIWKRTCPINSESNSTSDFDPELTSCVENLNTIEEFFDYFIYGHIVSMIVQCTNKRLGEETKKVDDTEIRGIHRAPIAFRCDQKTRH